MTPTTASSTSTSTARRRKRSLGALLLVAAFAATWTACAQQIGLDGIEYDRRLCGADNECTPPLICRGNAIGTFYCEPPPDGAQGFGQPAVAPTSSTGLKNCASGVDANGICTRPCRNSAQCGGTLPTCKNLPIDGDASRLVAVCQK